MDRYWIATDPDTEAEIGMARDTQEQAEHFAAQYFGRPVPVVEITRDVWRMRCDAWLKQGRGGILDERGADEWLSR